MDTSDSARMAVCLTLLLLCTATVTANARLVLRGILRKKNSMRARVIWPMLLLLMLFCAADALYIEPDWICETRHRIETPKLSPGSHIRIVHLTDLHMKKIGIREIQALHLTAMAQPDIIVLTGDYTVDKSPATMRMLTQVAKRLSSIAPTYEIDGNWDVEADHQALRAGGVKTLDWWVMVNKTGGARIAVGEAPWANPKMREPVPASVETFFKVLLCHKPEIFASAADQGIDLVLAGHTHGGQVRLPGFGAILPIRQIVGTYQSGLYHKGNSLLYVNRGVGMEGGHAPEVRFCCRPEVAVIDIVGKDKHK